MGIQSEIAKHFRAIYFGGNWASSNLKQHLTVLTWQQATTQVYDFNTIAALTYHVHYYVNALLAVLQGQPLTASDKYSFNHPAITCQQQWEQLLNNAWNEAENVAVLLEALPAEKLWQPFYDEKYGHYYSNIHGIIEHIHYHLGQMVLIKKIILQLHIPNPEIF